MMRLRAIRLINWYHFSDETFPIRGSTILAGDNGSGKSTVLDAVQLALVADMGQVRFNEAANEQSQRNLQSYVLYKRGTEATDGSGRTMYGRQTGTSYVVLYFADDMDVSKSFSGGLGLEATENDTSVSRIYFVSPGKQPAELPLVGVDGFVTTLRNFRPLIQSIGSRVFSDSGSYRQEIRHRLGPLPDSFHRSIVNALKFKQIKKVRDFVHHFMLEANPLATGSLLANLENYKRMEAEAKEAEIRIMALDAIVTAVEKVRHEQKLAESHRYLTIRAKQETADILVKSTESELEGNRNEKQGLDVDFRREDAQVVFWDSERSRVIALLSKDANFQTVQALKDAVQRTKDDLNKASSDERRLITILDQQRLLLEVLTSDFARNLRRAQPTLFANDDIIGIEDSPPLVHRLGALLQSGNDLGKRDLSLWTRRVDMLTNRIGRIAIALQAQLEELKLRGDDWQNELQLLQKGRQSYRNEVEALLHLLRQKLKGSRDPKPLCELIEIRNERWRDAVEGYLNTRRFDVLIAPEDFGKALGHYERNKNSYQLPGHGEVRIHGVGLVDMERIISSRPLAQARSLASQIETDDVLARAYCDYFLGDVITCDSEQELRRHQKAITDTVMVYQGYTARQTNPQVYRQHFIGMAAQRKRMADLEALLSNLAGEYQETVKLKTWADETDTLCRAAVRTITQVAELQEQSARIPSFREQLNELTKRLSQIDQGGLKRLEEEKSKIEERLIDLRKHLHNIGEQAGALKANEEHLHNKLKVQLDERDSLFLELQMVTKLPSINEPLEERYHQERASRSPQEIRAAFEPQLARAQIGIDKARQRARDLRVDYNNRFRFGGSIDDEEANEHASERTLWAESRLPEYLEKIQKTKNEAIQQLTEDIVFKLRERLLSVKQIIRDMNRAL